MTDASDRRAHHDIGGIERFACQPIETEAHALDEFDRAVDAIRQILSARGLMGVDELRRGIEALPEADYHRLTYYQRWLCSITATLIAKGVLTEAELAAALPR